MSARSMTMMGLKGKYKKEVIHAMQEKSGFKNSMAVPKIEKVVINSGFGKAIVGKTGEEQKKFQEMMVNSISLIAGQKAVLTKAKKAIAGFKLRQGMPIGVKVTLRGQKMYDFLERLIGIALPRSRDFRGIEKNSIDKNGNLTIALKEQISFPEISPEQAKYLFGFEVTVVTNARTKEESLELLRLLGLPIQK